MRKTFCAVGNYTEAMTTRPVYTPKLTRPFYQQEDVEFDWHSGTSPAQKQKNSALKPHKLFFYLNCILDSASIKNHSPDFTVRESRINS